MSQFYFEVFLMDSHHADRLEADEFLDSVEDALFEAFEGDVTPAFAGGTPVLYCTLERESIGDALNEVTSKIVSLGLHPTQLLMNMNSGYLMA